MPNTLEDRVVLVTGGGKGIGKAVLEVYAEQGCKVILVDKDREAGEQTNLALQNQGCDCYFIETDVSIPGDVEQMIRVVEFKYGRIDIVINNAGFLKWESPYDITIEQWDSIINTNLRGTFLCSREAAKIMRQNGGGSIINIASTRAIMSEPNSEAYAASKGGILALTHAMALSFAQDNIRVNAISPGWIEVGDYEALRPIDHKQHPAGRVGKPSDIAKACIYLTDPSNTFINGINLVIDGGMTRKMIYEE